MLNKDQTLYLLQDYNQIDDTHGKLIRQGLPSYKIGKGGERRTKTVNGQNSFKYPIVYTWADLAHLETSLHDMLEETNVKGDNGKEWFYTKLSPPDMYELCCILIRRCGIECGKNGNEYTNFHEGRIRNCTGWVMPLQPPYTNRELLTRFQTVQPIICDQPALEAPFEDNANTTKSFLLPPKKRRRQEMQNSSNCIIDTSCGVNKCTKQYREERDKLVVAELQRLFEFERVNAPEKDVPGSRYYSSPANIDDREYMHNVSVTKYWGLRGDRQVVQMFSPRFQDLKPLLLKAAGNNLMGRIKTGSRGSHVHWEWLTCRAQAEGMYKAKNGNMGIVWGVRIRKDQPAAPAEDAPSSAKRTR